MFFIRNGLITYKFEVRGMRCSMCEAHVNDLIRKNFGDVRVKSNHRKGLVIIQSKNALDIQKVKDVISSSGYEVGNIRKE